LDFLLNQAAEKSLYEIVLVNNNSSDHTEEFVKQFIIENPDLLISYHLEKKQGLSNARNKGISEAKGEIIAFIDDDGFARNDYVSTLIEISENQLYSNYIAFGGKVIPIYNKEKEPVWLSTPIQGLVSKVDLGDSIKPFIKKYPVGCNMAFRKEFFTLHGGFNSNLHVRSDDKFIFIKLKNAGLNVLYVPNLYVQHFMDDFRLEKKFIVRLSKIVGQSERIRLNEFGILSKLVKLVEYIFKCFASFAFAFIYTFKLEFSKAYYIVLVRWYVLIGFFIKKQAE
jgi:glycosyltransferase involved in cell wall biosynthesis